MPPAPAFVTLLQSPRALCHEGAGSTGSAAHTFVTNGCLEPTPSSQRDYAPYARGLIQVHPRKRAKSLSFETTATPFSMARAASCA